MENADPIQARLMDEQIVLVDADDRILGPASKRDCHLRTRQHPSGRLHRAFSVFLFDSRNRLLLQRRAPAKITFPSMWTNSCCSHPLFNENELETAKHMGVKRAAIRKLKDELGISSPALTPDDLRFVARIEYTAFQDDQTWIEHELDYLLFGRADVEIDANPNEVADYRFVTQDELRELLTHRSSLHGMVFTPWFDLICQDHLWKWWSQLDRLMESDANDSGIHRFGFYRSPN